MTEIENAKAKVPKVIFETYDMQVQVGRWLEIIPEPPKNIDIKKKHSFLNFFNRKKNEKTKTQEEHISKKVLEKVSHRFGELLLLMGVDNSVSCFLISVPGKECCFDCYFSNKEKARIQLYYSDEQKGPLIIFNDKFYEYYPWYSEDNFRFYFDNHNKEERTCARLYDNSPSFYLEKGNYSIKIHINDSVEIPIERRVELNQYVLGLSLPFKVDEIYKKLCSISPELLNQAKSLKIEVSDKNGQITDLISLEYGKLNTFTKTERGITITIHGDGKWSYTSSNLSVLTNSDGTLNYTLPRIPYNANFSLQSPEIQIGKVKSRIKETKRRVRKLIDENNLHKN